MTIEKLKADIDRQIARCNTYGYGLTAKVLERIKRLFDELEPSWHPYPDEKPTEKNGYIVSVVDESNGYCFTDASFYHPNLDRFEIDDVYQLHVYAWAERPKPYVKEADNDH